MKLEYLKTREIEATIEIVTGLHIGAGRDAVEIGGVDSPVIKHPHSQQPFVPGSSLKGKLRSLLEWALGKVGEEGKPWGSDDRDLVPACEGDEILRTFGTTRKNWEAGPTRLVVRDCHLEKEWVDRIITAGLPLTEDKTEVVIDRLQGKAANTGPRTMERVPGGARFRMAMLFRQYALDDDGGAGDLNCLNRLLEGMKLLEKDCLGGSGSRGYGQVRFTGLTVDGADVQARFDAMGPLKKEQAQKIVEK